jgi:hypothetical protein
LNAIKRTKNLTLLVGCKDINILNPSFFLNFQTVFLDFFSERIVKTIWALLKMAEESQPRYFSKFRMCTSQFTGTFIVDS